MPDSVAEAEARVVRIKKRLAKAETKGDEDELKHVRDKLYKAEKLLKKANKPPPSEPPPSEAPPSEPLPSKATTPPSKATAPQPIEAVEQLLRKHQVTWSDTKSHLTIRMPIPDERLKSMQAYVIDDQDLELLWQDGSDKVQIRVPLFARVVGNKIGPAVVNKGVFAMPITKENVGSWPSLTPRPTVIDNSAASVGCGTPGPTFVTPKVRDLIDLYDITWKDSSSHVTVSMPIHSERLQTLKAFVVDEQTLEFVWIEGLDKIEVSIPLHARVSGSNVGPAVVDQGLFSLPLEKEVEEPWSILTNDAPLPEPKGMLPSCMCFNID